MVFCMNKTASPKPGELLTGYEGAVLLGVIAEGGITCGPVP